MNDKYRNGNSIMYALEYLAVQKWIVSPPGLKMKQINDQYKNKKSKEFHSIAIENGLAIWYRNEKPSLKLDT